MSKQKKLIEDNSSDIENHNTDSSKDSYEDEEFEFNSEVDYANLQSKVTYEDEDYFHKAKLNDRIDSIFKASRWSIIGPNKKIPKDLIPLIFQDVLQQLEGSEFTMVEKFVSICDYSAISYTKAYESIHMKYKEIIVQEMDKKYGILGKKGIKKIF
jgi:hypothetical protein